MKLSDFDYPIPVDRIAQYPLKDRDASRLLILYKSTGEIEHASFRDIILYLREGDVLILNNTKVIPARLYGRKPTGGKVEITLLKEKEENIYDALVKGLNEGKVIIDEGIRAYVRRSDERIARVQFFIEGKDQKDIKALLHKIGVMPLPGYIRRQSVKADEIQYQTVYAQKNGAVAAPTAGLHFTEKLLHDIRESGIITVFITLHIGYGTFKPVLAEDVVSHQMDEEYYEIPQDSADAINSAMVEGRRIIAVGTSVTRALESSVRNGRVEAVTRSTSLFIYPGYKFKVINGMVTNFHLPKSSPMILVSALAGLEKIKRAYAEAIEKGYRFYSYGDAMLII